MGEALDFRVGVFLAETGCHGTSKYAPREVGWNVRALFGPIRSPFWRTTIRSGAGAALAFTLVFVFVFWVGGGIAAPENGEATDWASM